jgi:hypothetical protein
LHIGGPMRYHCPYCGKDHKRVWQRDLCAETCVKDCMQTPPHKELVWTVSRAALRSK